MFQSAPPHGGRQFISSSEPPSEVSIRAPARGATCTLRLNHCSCFVSIRAPARGATGDSMTNLRTLTFQSAPPHGGRLHGAKEALHRSCFNPRPRTGGDPLMILGSRLTDEFQSAPPHGGRHQARLRQATTARFNPRPRTGGDYQFTARRRLRLSFNPRPRTGGDTRDQRDPTPQLVSIRAPARGATTAGRTTRRPGAFQSAPPHGGRLEVEPQRARAGEVSIRAPARGATPDAEPAAADDKFQSAPPHGGRRLGRNQ